MTCGVYAIKNKITGQMYVGGSANIERRWSTHRSYLRTAAHHSRILQKSWDDHGAQAFVLEILLVVSADTLIDHEQQFIDRLKPHFNIHPNAASPLGVRRSAETKLKLSLMKRGVQPAHLAEYSRQCIGIPAPHVSESNRLRTGPRKPHSPETKAKISQANKGNPKLKNRGIKKPWLAERNRLGRGKSKPLGKRKLKLTAAAVLAIRADHRMQRVIAAEHGISQTTVSDIKNGKRVYDPPV